MGPLSLRKPSSILASRMLTEKIGHRSFSATASQDREFTNPVEFPPGFQPGLRAHRPILQRFDAIVLLSAGSPCRRQSISTSVSICPNFRCLRSCNDAGDASSHGERLMAFNAVSYEEADRIDIYEEGGEKLQEAAGGDSRSAGCSGAGLQHRGWRGGKTGGSTGSEGWCCYPGEVWACIAEVDHACEELIRSEVKVAFPEHRWLGEESVTATKLQRLKGGPCTSEWTWIVDPIDGTLNFIGGVPFAGVSIAVARGSETEVGIIYNPFMDELFQATKGYGAFLNGKKISALPRETELEDAIVTLGFTSKPNARVLMLEAISKVGPHCRTVRALGSAALHICYVAAGRTGCFFEIGLKPWDIAAARLVLEEAGGYVSAMDGKPLPPIGGSILATNGGILHGRIVQLLL